jgi:hypothetical protein
MMRKLADRTARGTKFNDRLTLEIAEAKLYCCCPSPKQSSMKNRY